MLGNDSYAPKQVQMVMLCICLKCLTEEMEATQIEGGQEGLIVP